MIAPKPTEIVRVKLTPAGRARLLMQHTMLRAKGFSTPDFVLEEDKDGFSLWEFYQFLIIFRTELYAGNPMPVCTEVQVKSEGSDVFTRPGADHS
jgi:hypothetical protein